MSIAIETPIHFNRAKAGRKKLAPGPELEPPDAPPDPVPRISRLMALAIHFDGLIRKGTVRDYADLARLGGVSRARITQIMNLLNLAPEIQEALLLRGTLSECDTKLVKERYTRGISSRLDWSSQRHCATQPPKNGQGRDQIRTRSSASDRRRIC